MISGMKEKENSCQFFQDYLLHLQPIQTAFTCSKLTREILEQVVK